MVTNDNKTLIAGDYRKWFMNLTNDSGGYKDLTGAKAVRFQLFSRGRKILSKDLTSGITLGVATSGEIFIELLSAETAGYNGEYYYECDVTDSAGIQETICNGKVMITSKAIR